MGIGPARNTLFKATKIGISMMDLKKGRRRLLSSIPEKKRISRISRGKIKASRTLIIVCTKQERALSRIVLDTTEQ